MYITAVDHDFLRVQHVYEYSISKILYKDFIIGKYFRQLYLQAYLSLSPIAKVQLGTIFNRKLADVPLSYVRDKEKI